MKKILLLAVFALIGTVTTIAPCVAHAESSTTNPGTDPADDMEKNKSETAANVSAPGCTKCQMYQKQLRMMDKTAAQPRGGSTTPSGDSAAKEGAQ